MSNQRYTPEFKDEAARQIVDRGYSVADVSKRLDVSAHSLLDIIRGAHPKSMRDAVRGDSARILLTFVEITCRPIGDGTHIVCEEFTRNETSMRGYHF